MRKVLLILTILLAFSFSVGWEVDNAYAEDAAWYDGILASAKSASGKAKVDGFFTAGKLFSVNYETIGTFDKLSLSAEKGSWFVKSEIGVHYGMFRPFIGYETLTNSYDQRTVGLDVFLFETSGVSMGLRNSYMTIKTTDVLSQRLLYSGILLKF